MLKALPLALALVASLGMSSALAGYAQLKPPDGFSRVGDAWIYRAANANEWLSSTVRTNATLNVGGRAVQVPAAMRLAANAGQFAASFARFNPALLAGTAVASYLLSQYEIENSGQAWFKYDHSVWNPNNPAQYGAGSSACPVHPSTSGADAWAIGYKCLLGGNTFAYVKSWTSGNPGCYTVHRYPPGGGKVICGTATFNPANLTPPTSTPRPVTDPEWSTVFPPHLPLPEEVVEEVLPLAPLPVDLPIINPSADPVPVPRPLRVPFGDPKPLPKSPTAPQTWSQPVVDIIGSPTVAEPWRVDLQPKDLLLDDPADAVTEPVTAPAPDPVTGVDPTPTVPKEAVDLETCGLPGTPPCKIDETGTPEKAPESIERAADDYKTSMDELRDIVKSDGDKGMFESLRGVFLVPPIAACSPFDLPNDMGSIDPCPVVDGVREVMAYIWALTALWWCLGMIREVI